MAEKVIILGTGPLAARVAAELAAHPDAGMLLGVIAEAPAVEPEFDCLALGALPDLRRILLERRPDRVVVAMRDEYRPLSADLLVEIQAYRGLAVETGMDACERITGKIAIESLDARSVLFSSGFRPSRSAMWFARGYSLVAAALGFMLFLPVMGLVALAIRLDSPGPVLFVQERVGLGNRRFKLLKFRSMRVTDRRRSEWEGDNVDRITRTGRWLRKFRLDELPQFINVLRGDMNLVGPRPHPDSNRRLFILVSRNTPECGEQIPYYSLRSSIRPGITGWAQVRYKYANGLDEEIEKLRYDLYYIKHYSLLLDLRILLETVKVVCLGHRKLEPSAASRQAIEDFAAEPDTVPVSQPLLPGLARALQSSTYPRAVRGPRLGPDRLGGAP